MENNLFDIINKSSSIVLLTHENPDGDAIGSVMALYEYLVSINKNVDAIIPSIPFSYKNVDNINVVIKDTDKQYDLGIILDCANKDRIGSNSDIFCRCKTTYVIDHHISNTKYGNYNLVDGNSPATCQYLYEIFIKNNISINKDMMKYMTIGIITDTGGFQNSNTNSNTFKIMSVFMENGVDIASLYRIYFSKKSIEQYNLHKIAIDRLEIIHNGKIAFTYITMDDYKKTSALDGSHEGIVDIGRNIFGVEVSIFMRESDKGYKFSLRSNDYVDVSKIAQHFNGGGHIRAAGGIINLSFKETKETLINEVIKNINE